VSVGWPYQLVKCSEISVKLLRLGDIVDLATSGLGRQRRLMGQA